MNIDTNRTIELRQMLMARRLELGSIVHSSIRDGRQRQPKDVGDIEEDSATVHQVDLDHVPAPNSSADGQAHRRGADAAGRRSIRDLRGVRPPDRDRRLRALPFAVRCTRCEDRREENGDRFREFAKKGGGFALVADSAGA